MREMVESWVRLFRGRDRAKNVRDVLLFVLLLGGLGFLIYYRAYRAALSGGQAPTEWYKVPDFFLDREDGRLVAGPLLRGLILTMQISAVSLVCALLIGLAAALLRLSGSWSGRRLARLYVETVRNTPLLTQIYLMYWVLARVLNMDVLVAAVASLSLFEGAYMSEIIRGGINSISAGQWEASHSLGMSRWQTYRHVVLPQALRRVLPPLTGQSVSLIKDSSLLSAIGVYELTKQADALYSRTFMVLEIWLPVAAVYLVLTLTLSSLAQWLERQMERTPGGATA